MIFSDGPNKQQVYELGCRLVAQINTYHTEHGRWPATVDQLHVEFPRDQYVIEYSPATDGGHFFIQVSSGPHKWSLISYTGVWDYDDGSD